MEHQKLRFLSANDNRPRKVYIQTISDYEARMQATNATPRTVSQRLQFSRGNAEHFNADAS